MSRNKAELRDENEVVSDNQIRLDINKIRKNIKQLEPEYIQTPGSYRILDKLILLALPSPSQHIH